ncbi:hypothetical protein SS50377_23085 [Spironucleus salmonicida]|uniref:Uncharacterized protein n=1 Tax=Spironucleus salmonicida TaxID=348837 RepID=V6LTL4_9EUKA|nr:hypothetical protein SS50377_23085 [Spironucleus salmonicida]|eukprot:EST47036.1 Hypothetical protein SS50377_12915 [Spironucleus salmonicida]
MSEFRRLMEQEMESQLSQSMPSVSLENITIQSEQESTSDDAHNVDSLVSQVAVNLLKMIVQLKEEIEIDEQSYEETSQSSQHSDNKLLQNQYEANQNFDSLLSSRPQNSFKIQQEIQLQQDHTSLFNQCDINSVGNQKSNNISQVQQLANQSTSLNISNDKSEIQQLINNEIQLVKLKQLQQFQKLQSNLQGTQVSLPCQDSNVQLQSVSQPKSQNTPSLIDSSQLTQQLVEKHKLQKNSLTKTNNDLTIRSTILQSDNQLTHSLLVNEEDEIVKMICSVSEITNNNSFSETRSESPLKIKMSQYIQDKKCEQQSEQNTIIQQQIQNDNSLGLSKSILQTKPQEQIFQNKEQLEQSIQRLLEQDSTVQKLEQQIIDKEQIIYDLQQQQINQTNGNIKNNSIISQPIQVAIKENPDYQDLNKSIEDINDIHQFVFTKKQNQQQQHEVNTNQEQNIYQQSQSDNSSQGYEIATVQKIKKIKNKKKPIVENLDIKLLRSYQALKSPLKTQKENLVVSQHVKSPQKIYKVKSPRIHQEKYSKKIYQLNQDLLQKDKNVTELQIKCNQMKTFTTAERQTNIEMRKKLKEEQLKRQDLQNEILQLKQSQDFQLQRSKIANLQLNKKLIKELTYIKNEQIRKSQLGETQKIQQFIEDSYIPNIEVIQPPRQKNIMKTQDGQLKYTSSKQQQQQSQKLLHSSLFNEDTDQLSTPTPQPNTKNQSLDKFQLRSQKDSLFDELQNVDSLVDNLFEKTIKQDTKLLLSPLQIKQVKIGLKDQILEVLKEQQQQNINKSLNFSPLKQQNIQIPIVQPPEVSQSILKTKILKDSLQSTVQQNLAQTDFQEFQDLSQDHPLNSSNISLPISLNDPQIQDLQTKIKQTPLIQLQSSQNPPYLPLNNTIFTSIPPQNHSNQFNQESSSAMSSFTQMSKIRRLKIKNYGEFSILFLIDFSEQNEHDTELFDLIKQLTGQLPSIHQFISFDQQIIQQSLNIFKQNSQNPIHLKLRGLLIIGIFCSFDHFPDQLKPAVINLISDIKQNMLFSVNMKVIAGLLDIIIAVEQLFYIYVQDLSESKKDVKGKEIIKNIIYSLQNLTKVFNIVDFRPFNNPSILCLLCLSKKLDKLNLIKNNISGELGACICSFVQQVNVYMKSIDNELLGFQTVGVGCLFCILIIFGKIEIDKDLQNIVFEQCQEAIRNCKGISQIPGFQDLMG